MADKLSDQEIIDISEQIIADLKNNIVRFGSLGKFDAADISEVYDILVDIVVLLENYSNTVKPISGDQKKRIVVNAINKLINIPIIPEFLEEKVFEYLIDIVVSIFNKIGGHKWIDVLFQTDENGVIHFLGRK